MKKIDLIPTARAVNFLHKIVGTGSCGPGSKKNIVGFVLGIFLAAYNPELYIWMQTEWIFLYWRG